MASSVTKLSLSPCCEPSAFQGGEVVLATRRTPSGSDIDHWLSM